MKFTARMRRGATPQCDVTQGHYILVCNGLASHSSHVTTKVFLILTYCTDDDDDMKLTSRKKHHRNHRPI